MINVQKKMEKLAAKASKASLAKAKKSENKVSNKPNNEPNKVEVKKRMAEIIQLPFWPDEARGVPNSILRSALFGIVRRGRRMYVEGRKIASIVGINIIYSGPQLDQADLDVWEECLQLSRSQVGNNIEFSSYSFLKKIQRATGKHDHEWLKKSLRRLQSAVVEITDGKRAYSGQLIHDYYRDGETKRNVIIINPKILSLYGDNGWTGIDQSQRLSLKSQPMAQWLHVFYSTHAKPYPYKVSTLRELCGSETKKLYHFRERLKKSYMHVSKVTGWKFWIDDKDLLHVEKTRDSNVGDTG